MFFEGDHTHKIDSPENALSTLITIGNCFVLCKTLHAALLIWQRVRVNLKMDSHLQPFIIDVLKVTPRTKHKTSLNSCIADDEHLPD